ncbi:hypothetical protein ACSHWB_31950 [Lentzea sp. HUAS TT2]|uniref:hypothetical protein n=1 Tax=Lentzea sp. HUAS TT2 TaxID=3447454 RepID=UPI003F7026EC
MAQMRRILLAFVECLIGDGWKLLEDLAGLAVERLRRTLFADVPDDEAANRLIEPLSSCSGPVVL